jgi:hypothetical protein
MQSCNRKARGWESRRAAQIATARRMKPIRALPTTISFEPIASIDVQGFFVEDMYSITKDDAELLTLGVTAPNGGL